METIFVYDREVGVADILNILAFRGGGKTKLTPEEEKMSFASSDEAAKDMCPKFIVKYGEEEMEVTEYEDGPWAARSSAYIDAAGYWYFPGPDVPDKGEICNPILFGPVEQEEDEVKQPIQIEPLEQGFLVGYGQETLLALTDRVDAAEWLLGWLGFEDEIVDSVLDILEGLWDADELYRTDGGPCTWEQPEGIDTCTEAIEKLVEEDYQNRLDVLGAALAYVEHPSCTTAKYIRLRKAVSRWRGIDSEDLGVSDARISSLDVAKMEGG